MASKLLVVFGFAQDAHHIKDMVKPVGIGIERWIQQLPGEEQEQLTRALNSIPSMKTVSSRNSEDSAILDRYIGKVLDITVLINPTGKSLKEELVDFFSSSSPRRYVDFGGFIMEDSGDWLLQDGLFSIGDFMDIVDDTKVSSTRLEHNTKVTIACCKLGPWKTALSEKFLNADSKITFEIMDSQSLSFHVSDADKSSMKEHSIDTQGQRQNSIEDLTSFLESRIVNELPGIFNLLEPPQQEAFLKIRGPCLYVFPGCNGDSAFFTVNGFNMLINGGGGIKPLFWKLIRHVDRVDSILVTHLGSDNLPGLNSLLRRKLEEREMKLPVDEATAEYQGLRRRLISPTLGPLFMNVPAKLLKEIKASKSTVDLKKTDLKPTNVTLPSNENFCQTKLKTLDVVKDFLRHSLALNVEMTSVVRKNGPKEPTALFSKVGLGRLDMHVLSPVEGSKELLYINEKWGCNGKSTTPVGKTGVTDSSGTEYDSSVSNLSSICALLVWHPTDVNEKITRVLFPGNASQTKIFKGLETIKNLPFMKMQFATKKLLSKQKQTATNKPNDVHQTPKASRPFSSSYVPKKTPVTMPKKAASVSSTPLRKASSVGKLNEQKSKVGRPASARATLTFKAPAAKDRALHRSAKADPIAQKLVAKLPPAKKRTTSLSASFVASPKPNSKRTVAVGQRTPVVKQRPSSALMSDTKPKKTEEILLSKKKPNAQRSAFRSSQRPAAKKPLTKVPTDKNARYSKTSSTLAGTAAPAENLIMTMQFVKCSPDTEKNLQAAESSSVGSEELTSASTMSDLLLVEDENRSTTAEHTGSLSLLENKTESGSPRVVGLDEALKHNKAKIYTFLEPEISEDSDMISTDGSSLPAALQSPVDGNFISACLHQRREEEFLSSDKSTPSQEEQQHTVKVSTISEDDITVSAREANEHLPAPLDSLQRSSASEMAPVSDTEGISMDTDGRAIFDEAVAVAKEEATAIVKEVISECGRDIVPVDWLQSAKQVESSTQLAKHANVTYEVEPTKEMESEDHSSSNSSVEGSYDLNLADGSVNVPEFTLCSIYNEPPADKDLDVQLEAGLHDKSTIPEEALSLTGGVKPQSNEPVVAVGLCIDEADMNDKAVKSCAALGHEVFSRLPGERFSLHGESSTTENFTNGLENQANLELTDTIWQHRGDILSQNRPLFMDLNAQSLDIAEAPVGFDQLKLPAELNSPLDANAEPFIPKSSSVMPVEQMWSSEVEMHIGQGDSVAMDEMYAAPSVSNIDNPFVMDLMGNLQIDGANLDEALLPPVRGLDPCAAQDKVSKGAVKKSGQAVAAARRAAAALSPFYVDLAYVPNHGNKNSVDVEFFKMIRAKYYVISGNDRSRDEPSVEVLNHLLEGRRSWHSEAGQSSDQDDRNITIIPTYNTQAVQEWYTKNCDELASCNIHMITIDGKVMESIEACKIEFR